MESIESQPAFASYLLHVDLLLGLFSAREMKAACSSETSVEFLTNYTALYHRRHNSS
jgi:hypothetical protein